MAGESERRYTASEGVVNEEIVQKLVQKYVCYSYVYLSGSNRYYNDFRKCV